MTPIAQSAGVMTALTDMASFVIGAIENHAGFFLGLLGVSIVVGLISRKLAR